mgnify:CR=1 FL=1
MQFVLLCHIKQEYGRLTVRIPVLRYAAIWTLLV